MSIDWRWKPQDRTYSSFGNANQWTVNAGMASLARESAQNSNDARIDGAPADLVYSFIRLTGVERDEFLDALGWTNSLEPHLRAMAQDSDAAVAAGQIRSGLESMTASDSLLLLRISDYGCAGLTGAEFLDQTPLENFAKLCRMDLFSGKDKAAGGSFGLGKAVYWRFSRLQTVLFNSTLPKPDPVSGSTHRLFGVNQGVTHRVGDRRFQNRGHFGLVDPTGEVASAWDATELADRLLMTRSEDRPGTTTMLVGFHDPDRPDLGLKGPDQLLSLADDLRAGLEESFWPLLTRGRLKVRIEVLDGSKVIRDQVVDPEETYTELVRALRRFDAGDLDESLTDPFSVVARDIPIDVSRRKSPGDHEKFVHQAKLVVTVSDDSADALANKVCLLRQPEMIVQTIDRSFEGRSYHAFLLAGGALNPGRPTLPELRADDFLRFAEPPAHDRWVPGKGRGQTSQANLNGRYFAPWVPHLQGIETQVLAALNSLFSQQVSTEAKPPQALLKRLEFLRGDAGTGGRTSPSAKKPQLDVLDAAVVDGRWTVDFEVKVKNRAEGWRLTPRIALLGMDGSREQVAWQTLTLAKGDGAVTGVDLDIPAAAKGRFIKVRLRGVSTAELPIPAAESFAEVTVHDPRPIPGGEDQ